MGTFNQTIQIGPAASGPFEAVVAMVDTGSLYTWVPASVLHRLGVRPSEQQTFVMANGSRIRHDIAEAVVKIGDRTRNTLCVFGEEGSLVLLGAYTLEGFGLAADPVNKRLVPMEVIPALTLLPFWEASPVGGALGLS